MPSYEVTVAKTGTITITDAPNENAAMAAAEQIGIHHPERIQWDDDWSATDAHEL